MESIKQLADDRDKLKGILISLISDIEDMKCEKPTGVEQEINGEYWFGGFGSGWVDDERFLTYIEWPNLAILLEKAKKAIK